MLNTSSRSFAYLMLAFIVAASSPLAFSRPRKLSPEEVFREDPLFMPVPMPVGKPWLVQNFGPVGIGIKLIRPDFTMQINNVEEGSPAAEVGTLKKGQIIESINGEALGFEKDPRLVLGDIITKAEAADGKITLNIRDVGDVTVTIPVMGAYSETWPMGCPKSDKIVRKFADALAKQEKPRWGSVLFLLSTGEEKDLEVVRKWMAEKESIGSYPWHAGYLGIGVCEYYLRTGDETVLPLIKDMSEELKVTMYNGGWSGRGKNPSFTYSTGTGQMHAAGVHSLTFLLLAKMCGVDIDEYMLQKSLRTFYRFAGHDNVPYGDGWPEGGFRDNGKSAGLAVAMAAAARLTPEGESSVYATARDHVAMKSFYATSWFHVAHTGGGIGEIWHHAAMASLREKRPVQYRSYMDTRRWVMELSRRHDGTIGIAGFHDRYDKSASEHERSWGTYFALTYTLPRKKLQLFGAPKTEWCESYELPVRPWGRSADDAFVDLEPVENSPLKMEHILKEVVPRHSSLPLFEMIEESDSDEVFEIFLHHPEMGIRTAVMRFIVNGGRDDLVLPLLKSDDPRLRHAGLLAITGMFKGRSLPGDKLTPEMFELVGQMIEDPDEALWVVQQALKAIKRAGPEVIASHRETILDYMKHDDWFLRTSAIEALEPIYTDPDHYEAVMPLMFKTLSEFTTASALNPVWSMEKSLARATPEVKAFAFDELKKAYAAIPQNMTFPGGQVVPNGADVVRSRIALLIKRLPGGEAFVRGRPMMTLAAAQSGKEEDRYRYSGTFTPNKDLIGTWIWVLWPTPDRPEEIDECIDKWLKKYAKQGQKALQRPKDTLRLLDGGKLKSSSYFKSYFWSGDMLISPQQGIARKMTIRTVDGIDFLLVEKDNFQSGNASGDWHSGYSGYVRLSDVESPGNSKK